MHIDYPCHFDSKGHTAEAGDDKHIRNLIEQVLFTSPGERVNRPTLGSGVLRLLFAPNSDALAAATQLSVQGALQQWLGNLIEVGDVQVENNDATLNLTVRYVIRRSGELQTASFTRSA
jgi:hypothetical protein